MSVKKFIIVTQMQNVLIMKDLSPASVSQVTMEMGLQIVIVSSKIIILTFKSSCMDCVVSASLTIGSTLGSLSFVLVVAIVGTIACICCFVRRYSKTNRNGIPWSLVPVASLGSWCTGADLGILIWWGCKYNCVQKFSRPRPFLMNHVHF